MRVFLENTDFKIEVENIDEIEILYEYTYLSNTDLICLIYHKDYKIHEEGCTAWQKLLRLVNFCDDKMIDIKIY